MPDVQNPLHSASVLVTSLAQANEAMMDGGPIRVSSLDRVRPGTDERELIAVVVYPYEYDKIGGATAIALVTDLEGHPVWVNPASEGRSTAMFIGAAMACAVAQRDQQAAYEGPTYESRAIRKEDRVEIEDPEDLYDGRKGTIARVGSGDQVGVRLNGEEDVVWVDVAKLRPLSHQA